MAANGPLKWHGGKSYLAPHIHAVAPPSVRHDPERGYTHRNYAFAGGLGELWGWECEGISEAANDLNSLLSAFWSALAEPQYFEAMAKILRAVPFSQEKWEEARDALDFCHRQQHHVAGHMSNHLPARAAFFFILNRQSRQGLMKDYATPTTRTRRGMNENVSAWLSAVEGLPEWHERFKRVEVRNMPAVDFIRRYDHERALFYCDPPYLHETRVTTSDYAHEMTPEQHLALLDALSDIRGRFILSGYPSGMYDDRAVVRGWHRREIAIDNKASSAREKAKKIECLWTNYEPPALAAFAG